MAQIFFNILEISIYKQMRDILTRFWENKWKEIEISKFMTYIYIYKKFAFFNENIQFWQRITWELLISMMWVLYQMKVLLKSFLLSIWTDFLSKRFRKYKHFKKICDFSIFSPFSRHFCWRQRDFLKNKSKYPGFVYIYWFLIYWRRFVPILIPLWLLFWILLKIS